MKSVAAIFAHPDDEVLGCGASLHRYSSEGYNTHILILATGLASRGPVDEKQIMLLQDQAKAAARILKAKSVEFYDFPDNQMDTVPLLSVVKKVEEFIKRVKPSVIFTHHEGDINIDHDVTNRAVLTALRTLPNTPPVEVFACEILSSTEFGSVNKMFKPHCYIRVADGDSIAAVNALRCYESEVRSWPHPRSEEALMHQIRLRGTECGWGAAEAFEVLRLVK